VKIENVERRILKVEGFNVCFLYSSVGNVRSDKEKIPQFPFRKRARDLWTVEDWKARRFLPHYPGFEVEVKFSNCDSDSKKPGWAADQRSVCQQVYPIRPHGS